MQFLVHADGEDKNRYRWFMTDETGAEGIIQQFKQEKPHVSMVKEDLNRIMLDGGGAICVDEPRTEFECVGVKFGTFVRHIPFMLEYVKDLKESKQIPGHVSFGGQYHIYIVSLDVRDSMINALTKLSEMYAKDIVEWEAKIAGAFSSPGTIYLGKCSCQSGKLYTECCGKPAKNN